MAIPYSIESSDGTICYLIEKSNSLYPLDLKDLDPQAVKCAMKVYERVVSETTRKLNVHDTSAIRFGAFAAAKHLIVVGTLTDDVDAGGILDVARGISTLETGALLSRIERTSIQADSINMIGKMVVTRLPQEYEHPGLVAYNATVSLLDLAYYDLTNPAHRSAA